ncbi:uncharacterized protein ATC70_008910 [Mucor velutinosus]|uniref:SUR7/PalI family-domain-containing protein n=1 Tax=Mucor velutinosus TaxID=708070 RepID=A0AAN7DKD3_9FUNG|nr:hypothetical protein ATC70_008910 [Mucor velutinosus]
MIGQLSNRQFLNKLYYASAWNPQQNLAYNFGLWNYCTGGSGGGVASCAHPTPAYNWAKTPNIVGLVPHLASSWMVKGLFLGLFILVFIALGFSFIFWLMSLPICCLKRRGWGYSMSTLVFINFMIMLVALILALILVLAGIQQITSADNTWHAHAGNSLWLTIGATLSLLASFLCYSGGACFGRRNRTAYDDNYNGGSTSRRGCCGIGRRRNKAQVDPNYKDNTGYDNNVIPGTNQPLYAASPVFQHTPQRAQDPNMLQQPYMVSPSMGQQQLSPGISHAMQSGQNYDHNASNNMGGATTTATGAADSNDPNSVSVPMHGYQTPVLQPANTPQ